jgi:hypothetical protein
MYLQKSIDLFFVVLMFVVYHILLGESIIIFHATYYVS